jgi:patatin-like phospholipase/acyl hydrolase
MATPYCILSLDGGGIRGIISAIWLNRLEAELEHPLHEYFDLIAGTSTGAILACAVSLGIPTERIIELYRDKGRIVFPAAGGWLGRIKRRVKNLFAPRYDGRGLDDALREVFGDARFAELKVKPTLITTYNTLDREAVIFKNTRALCADIPVWQLCRASSSAPLYFPAQVIKVGNAEMPLVDGGLVANNPTACAIAEAVKLNRRGDPDRRAHLSDFVVASFGTGEATDPISIRDAQKSGLRGWALRLIDVLFDGPADVTHYIAKHFLADDNYFRFQTPLKDAYESLDNADPVNVNALASTADSFLYAKGGDTQITRLADRLAVARKHREMASRPAALELVPSAGREAVGSGKRAAA